MISTLPVLPTVLLAADPTRSLGQWKMHSWPRASGRGADRAPQRPAGRPWRQLTAHGATITSHLEHYSLRQLDQERYSDSSEKSQEDVYVYRRRFITGNWHRGLWRLVKYKKTSSGWTSEPGLRSELQLESEGSVGADAAWPPEDSLPTGSPVLGEGQHFRIFKAFA